MTITFDDKLLKGDEGARSFEKPPSPLPDLGLPMEPLFVRFRLRAAKVDSSSFTWRVVEVDVFLRSDDEAVNHAKA